MKNIAKNVFRVKVTRGDIDKGVRDTCMHCPVARAVVRALSAGGAELHTERYRYIIRVDNASIHIYYQTTIGRDTPSVSSEYCHWDLPGEIRQFIRDFDNGEVVNPTEFDLVWS